MGEEIELDDVAAQLWDWFWDAGSGRQTGFNGPQPLLFSELRAWAEMTGNIVRPEEWQILRDMDQAFIRAASKKDGEDDPENRPVLTPAAFDAMFG